MYQGGRDHKDTEGNSGVNGLVILIAEIISLRQN